MNTGSDREDRTSTLSTRSLEELALHSAFPSREYIPVDRRQHRQKLSLSPTLASLALSRERGLLPSDLLPFEGSFLLFLCASPCLTAKAPLAYCLRGGPLVGINLYVVRT